MKLSNYRNTRKTFYENCFVNRAFPPEEELFLNNDNNKDDSRNYSRDESLQLIVKRRRGWNSFVDTSESE